MIRCLIVDDEPLARDILSSYVEESDELELIAICRNAKEANSVLRDQTIDLLFLDINMPNTSGISFYKTIIHKPKVIFTTAYSEYAVEGFDLEAVDYLLKPFSFERFRKAIEKLNVNAAQINSSFIMLKSDKRIHKIDFDDILYFESIGDYVKVYLEEKKALIISDTLKKLEEKLPSSFLRVHKSFIISADKLIYIEGNRIMVADQKIPVGQSYREKVQSKFSR